MGQRRVHGDLTQLRTKLIMNRIILLTAFVAVCQAQYIASPYGLSAPLTYGAASFGYRTAAAPVVTIKAAPVVTVKAAPAPVITVKAAPAPVVTVNTDTLTSTLKNTRLETFTLEFLDLTAILMPTALAVLSTTLLTG